MQHFFSRLYDYFFVGRSSPYFIFKLHTDKLFRLVYEWRQIEFSFDVQLVEHCDLNCQMCQHFSNIAKPEIYAPAEYEKDLRRLSAILGDEKILLKLVGGEPLLHPDPEKMFSLSREVFPHAMIVLITNGLRLPKMKESFWRCCRECDIIIRCSTYPVPVDWESVKKAAKKFDVPLIFHKTHAQVSLARPLKPEDTVFTSGHWVLDLQGKQDAAKSFSLCHMKHCVTLMNGMLGHCSISARIRHFNDFFGLNLKNEEGDFLALSDDLNLFDLRKYFSSNIPFCRYCKPQDFSYGHIFALTKKNITEWT